MSRHVMLSSFLSIPASSSSQNRLVFLTVRILTFDRAQFLHSTLQLLSQQLETRSERQQQQQQQMSCQEHAFIIITHQQQYYQD